MQNSTKSILGIAAVAGLATGFYTFATKLPPVPEKKMSLEGVIASAGMHTTKDASGHRVSPFGYSCIFKTTEGETLSVHVDDELAQAANEKYHQGDTITLDLAGVDKKTNEEYGWRLTDLKYMNVIASK